MKNGSNKPLEDEFRSSHVYRALTRSGSAMADKIAKGLGIAAAEIDNALTGNGPSHGHAGQPGPAGGTPGHVHPGRTQPPPSSGGYYRYPGPSGQPASPSSGPGMPNAPGNGQALPQPGTAPRQGTWNVARPPQNGQARQPQAAPVPAPQPPMKMIREPSKAKYIITAVSALLYALRIPMTGPADFAVFGIVLASVFLLSSLLFKGKKKFVPIDAPEKPRRKKKKQKGQPEETVRETVKEEKTSKTGDPEVDKIIDEGNDYLRKLREANDAIPDEALSDCISRMEKASADIFAYIAENPSKAPQIRKFMSYYLPTTLKLLKSYQRLSSQSAKGENITSTMFHISGMMHTVADAFEKQLDSLFSEEAMDISADITVFETLLKQEGYVEEEMKQKG